MANSLSAEAVAIALEVMLVSVSKGAIRDLGEALFLSSLSKRLSLLWAKYTREYPDRFDLCRQFMQANAAVANPPQNEDETYECVTALAKRGLARPEWGFGWYASAFPKAGRVLVYALNEAKILAGMSHQTCETLFLGRLSGGDHNRYLLAIQEADLTDEAQFERLREMADNCHSTLENLYSVLCAKGILESRVGADVASIVHMFAHKIYDAPGSYGQVTGDVFLLSALFSNGHLADVDEPFLRQVFSQEDYYRVAMAYAHLEPAGTPGPWRAPNSEWGVQLLTMDYWYKCVHYPGQDIVFWTL